jgi:hypothetical protein
MTASATYHRPLGGDGLWASTIAWGRNSEPGHSSTSAVLLETSATIADRHIVFGRVELNQKTGHDLAIPALDERVSTLTKWQGGYTFELRPL